MKIEKKWLWWSAGVALLYNMIFLAWMLFKPEKQDDYKVLADVGELFGALLAMFFCLCSPTCLQYVRSLRQLHKSATSIPHSIKLCFPWGSFLLGLSFAGTTLGYVIYTYYDTHNITSFPSLGDVAFLSACLFQIAGVLLLPGRPSSTRLRLRLLLDSLMSIITIVTFCWYFILGPTFLQEGETLLAKIVGSAYPLFDLIMIFCVFFLMLRPTDPQLHTSYFLLIAGLLCLVPCDYLYDYIVLHGTYVNGWLDAGWSIADALQGLAMLALPLHYIHQPKPATTIRPLFWRAFLPYIQVPAILGLVIFTWQTNTTLLLSLGVYLGAALLLLMLFIRQVLTIQETSHLNEALSIANARLATMANTDSLTNLPNHGHLLDILEQEVGRSDRSGQPISLLFFDGDHFKRVNDTYGHAIGDLVLRELSERVKSSIRVGDTIGRYGGEEFLVILPATETEEAKAIAERLRASLAITPLARDQVKGGIPTTISIGLATYPQDGIKIDEVKEKADQAMYWAKRLGRNQICSTVDAVKAEQDVVLKAATAFSLERQDATTMICWS